MLERTELIKLLFLLLLIGIELLLHAAEHEGVCVVRCSFYYSILLPSSGMRLNTK